MTLDTEGRNPAVTQVARYFDYEHLSKEKLRDVSRECAFLAEYMLRVLEDSPELTAGLRKLLEAKDCFVRAAL